MNADEKRLDEIQAVILDAFHLANNEQSGDDDLHDLRNRAGEIVDKYCNKSNNDFIVKYMLLNRDTIRARFWLYSNDMNQRKVFYTLGDSTPMRLDHTTTPLQFS